MVIGEVKSFFKHQGVLEIKHVIGNGKVHLVLTQDGGACHFSVTLDPDQVEHMVDMLRLAKRSAGEDLAQARA